MFVTDSLFTLEFSIDKLTISPGVICRFPAVAFRFLDFPTITLHLLEEQQRDRLRAKLTIDPEYQIPEQIKDYQNQSGYYEFHAGKSCLYRLPPDTLRSLLAQVPLYIIIADGFTAAPTLVGSAMLPLTEPMEEVYEMLLKDGVSVPASSGVRSSLTVYNLMGHAIGQVVVGCRLNSLGMALLSHLPHNSVASYHQYRSGIFMPSFNQLESADPKATHQPITEEHNISVVLGDIANEQAAKKYPIIHVESEPDVLVAREQTDVVAKEQKETQTRYKKEKKEHSKENDEPDEGIELIVPDVYCPPPLYYNKRSRAQPVIPLQLSLDLNDSQSESSSRDTCESVKDLKRSPSLSEFGKPPPELQPAHTNDIRNVETTTDIQGRQLPVQPGVQFPAQLASVLRSATSTANTQLDGFPLISALVTELLNIGTSSSPPAPAPPVSSTPIKSGRKSPARKPTELSSPKHPLPSLTVTREPSPDVLKRPTTPASRHKPAAVARKGPLVFGYTNTQKLRLSKTNPNLLKQIEEAEAKTKLKKAAALSSNDMQGQRSTKLRIPKGKRKEGQRSFRSYTSQQPLDISTEMGRLTTELAEVKRELAAQRTAQQTPRMNAAPERVELGVTRILTPKVGRVISPRPSQLTPRRSMSALSNRNSRDADLSTLHELSIQSDSRRSLEIHLPTPVLDETEARLSSEGRTGSEATDRGADDGEYNTTSKRDDSMYHSTQEGGDYSRTEATADMGDDYSMIFSPEAIDSSASPLGLYRDSYGSDSFVSED